VGVNSIGTAPKGEEEKTTDVFLKRSGELRGRLCATTARKESQHGQLTQLCCTRDEGRSLGVGLQGQAPNRQRLLRHNGRGGERDWKRRA
jgi:hypothetical protein